MSIKALDHDWWSQPLDKYEKSWIKVAVVWCLFITILMPIWHFTAKHNVSAESYRITTDDFDIATDRFIKKYQTGEEKGVPVVEPPANSDIFMRGAQFEWTPILKLKKGQTYRLHLSSIDVNHGWSVLPINMNFEAVPGYDFVLTITPTTSGEHIIQCNEFCGIGHHTMIGKIYVD